MSLYFSAEKSTSRLSRQIAVELLKYYQPHAEILPRIARYIEQHKTFLLTTHVGGDADGIGSEIGLYHLLKSLNKDVWILNNETVPEYLKFIDPDELVKDVKLEEQKDPTLIKKIQNRFVFILDSSELKRSDRVAELFQSAGCSYATIDHHILPRRTNYCADDSYGATAEIIWDLYKYLKIKIKKEAALALYTGIVADTGNFRYPKTSLRTHLAGGDLLSQGIHSDFIYRALYESQPADRLRFLQRVLKKTHIDKRRGYAIAEIKPRMLRGLELGDSPNEGIVNILLGVKDIRVSAVITETPDGGLKCSLRSKGDFNVADIAREFGGGGHKNAAGLKANGSYRSLRRKLIATIHRACEKGP
ncbi:MAG: DHH family phosphoesterase [Fischerella sp.]|nr:DHH family phosphoesterase [Fischerella sp.]